MLAADRDGLRVLRVTPDPLHDYAGHWYTRWRQLSVCTTLVPEPICSDTTGELQFAMITHGRAWRFDWCIPEVRIAVEVDGGKMLVRRTKLGQIVPVGRHVQDEDLWKLNLAAELHWAVFNFTIKMLQKEPERCVQLVDRCTLDRIRWVTDNAQPWVYTRGGQRATKRKK